MIRLIRADSGGEMWVHESRLDEYLAAGHRPAAPPRPYSPESGAAPQTAPLEHSGETSSSERDGPSRSENGGTTAAEGRGTGENISTAAAKRKKTTTKAK